VKSFLYEFIYRMGAPWDRVGVRKDLIDLVESGRVDANRYPRSVDLGCGSGANAVYLAEHGFASHGVDFSPVAIEQARQRASGAGVEVELVVGDLTAGSVPGLEGPFDLLVDFGTLDDLRGDKRRAMAGLITSLARPGSVFLEWCFYGETEELPRFSFKGPSRMYHIAPGELDELFGDSWEIEPFSRNEEWLNACFLLTRRAG
jgi:SAM-dependent methyltransferase